MTTVTDADREMAEILAAMICGCADVRQRRGDVNQLLAYREAEVSKEVAKIVAWADKQPPTMMRGQLIEAIEAGEYRNDA